MVSLEELVFAVINSSNLKIHLRDGSIIRTKMANRALGFSFSEPSTKFQCGSEIIVSYFETPKLVRRLIRDLGIESSILG